MIVFILSVTSAAKDSELLERMDDILLSESKIKYPEPSKKIQFERENVLGASNSPVFCGTFDGQSVAVKRIEKRYPPSPGEDREIAAQIHLDHRNVVKMITAEQDDDFRYQKTSN